jgi:hypothetical protein
MKQIDTSDSIIEQIAKDLTGFALHSYTGEYLGNGGDIAEILIALLEERDALLARVNLLESARRAFGDAWTVAHNKGFASGYENGQIDMREKSAKCVEGGVFLLPDSPPAIWAKQAAPAIRALAIEQKILGLSND